MFPWWFHVNIININNLSLGHGWPSGIWKYIVLIVPALSLLTLQCLLLFLYLLFLDSPFPYYLSGKDMFTCRKFPSWLLLKSWCAFIDQITKPERIANTQGFCSWEYRRQYIMNSLPIKHLEKIIWRNDKHDFNAQQGSKECKGNIKERKVRNLKSDMSRHWGFCHVSGGWNIWELEFYQPHMFRRKNVESILTSPCKPVMLIMLHLRLLDESGFYKMAPQR